MILALWCVAAALACWVDRPRRLPAARSVGPPAVEKPVGVGRVVLVGLAAGAAVLVVRPDGGVAAGVAAGAVGLGVGALAGWEARRGNARPGRVRGEIALLYDLWAAGLDGGMPTGSALTAALDVLARPGPVDPTVQRLVQVAGLLRVGADVDRAWQPADGDPWLEPVAAASRRSAQAGADLAITVREQARAARRAEAGADERRAQRAGVLMTAPLTLCYLPAFVCLGLAPVVIALVGTLDLGR